MLSPEQARQAITQGTQLAYRRQIVVTPMPTGANSSKNLNGPVYVDPAAPVNFRRPVAVHETVEQLLMRQGVPYPQAHKVATQAEKIAVMKAGINWMHYTHTWDGVLAKVEHMPVLHLPKDLHVSPAEAMGHHGGKHAVQANR